MANILEGLFGKEESGFSKDDRTLLVRLAQKLEDHIDSNSSWHEGRARECKEIKEEVSKAHLRINDIKNNIARKEGLFTGAKATWGIISALALAVISVIWALVKELKH